MELQKMAIELYESILDTLHQMKLYREKTGTETKVIVKLMDRYGHTQETIPGLLTKDKKFCFLPTAELPVANPEVWTEKGRQYVYVSKKSLDNSGMGLIFDVAENLKHTIKARWMSGRNWVTMEILNCKSSIDFGLFDNEHAINWAQKTHDVNSGNIMQAVTERRSSKMVMMLLLVGFFGMLLGGFIALVLT